MSVETKLPYSAPDVTVLRLHLEQTIVTGSNFIDQILDEMDSQPILDEEFLPLIP